MEIVGDRRFVEIPGDKLHELPPLFIPTTPEAARLDRAMEMAETLVEEEDMIPALPVGDPTLDLALERRRIDLAVQIVEQYLSLIEHWRLGDSILDWIRHCEAAFELSLELRPLLRPDVWPHAGRSSFVTLLRDKAVKTHGLQTERAVGLRLSFRQPPPLSCFSNQFLFFLNSTVASTAYDTWAGMNAPASSLPPERFSFLVHEV
jgi:hypothetical protein